MPGSATSACTNEPIAERTSRPSLPPCRSSSQRSGQSASVCSVDGDSRTTWSSPDHSGSSVLGAVMPYHCLGSAPDTPAAASRANCAAAQARTVVGDGALGCADHRAEPADQRRGRQHPRGGHRLGGWVSASVANCGELDEERRGQHRVVAACRCRPRSPAGGCGRGPWRRSAACAPRPAAAPGWTLRGHGLADHPVEDVDEVLGAEHAAARSRVGPQPFLQSGDDDDVPFPAEGGVRADQRDAVDVGRRVARRGQRTKCASRARRGRAAMHPRSVTRTAPSRRTAP